MGMERPNETILKYIIENTHHLYIYQLYILSRNPPLYQDYIHKVSVILHDSLQRESDKPYGPPTSVTWLQLLRKQANTGTSAAVTTETHWPMHTRLYALSRLVTSAWVR
jgi:hypothetical protein